MRANERQEASNTRGVRRPPQRSCLGMMEYEAQSGEISVQVLVVK